MSEKLLTPLDVMPAALRHSIETILKKHQRLDQNPSAANSSNLSKPYEALKSSWAELQWKPFATDLQQREKNLTQQQAARPTIVQTQLDKAKGSYARSFQERRLSLERRKQLLEQRKEELRNSMRTTRHELAEKSRLLSLPFEQFVNEQPLGYDDEWQSAEKRIAEQNMLLQQSEACYKTDLQQHETLLRSAFGKNELRLKQELHNSPLELARLQQLNAQLRAELPDLVATWKAAAAVRETSLREQLDDWKANHQTLAAELPNWSDLNVSGQQLSDWKPTLTARHQRLQERKQRLTHAEQTMHAEWQRVSAKPSLSAPPSAEQKRDWLQKSLPLRTIWRELLPLMKRCALLKAELLTIGLLSADDYPEIEVDWANVEFI
jgi:hypothetical protein